MKMKKALLAFALAGPAVALAGEADHWYVTPEIGGISPDYRLSLQDENWLFGVALGREINQYFNVELNTEADRLNYRKIPGQVYTYSTTLDGLFILNRAAAVAPYLRLGVGGVMDTPSSAPDHTHLGADAGIGTYLNLWQSSDETATFSLRPEIKVLWDEPGKGDHATDYIATLGLQYAFGGQPVEAAPPPPAAPPPAATQP
ncbi:MAG: outer membrane beta-barrel protein, partial [Steroidobacteraceae bacterium]